MTALLRHISDQLADPSLPGSSAIATGELVESSDIAVTTLWVFSIVLSLSSAMFGILCKQWIREYQRDIAESPKNALKRRQLRYKALQQWMVPEIISLLPVLIELAVVLFFTGMMKFLWGLNAILSSIVTVAIALMLLCVVMTTVLPAVFHPYRNQQSAEAYENALQNDAAWLPYAYRSPQSRAFRMVISGVLTPQLAAIWRGLPWLSQHAPRSTTLSSWATLENALIERNFKKSYFAGQSMRWIREHTVNNPEDFSHFFRATKQNNLGTQISNIPCAAHAEALPAFMWSERELEMLERAARLTSCLQAVQLRSCENCRLPERFSSMYQYIGIDLDHVRSLEAGQYSQINIDELMLNS
jgi:hypothetical protein